MILATKTDLTVLDFKNASDIRYLANLSLDEVHALTPEQLMSIGAGNARLLCDEFSTAQSPYAMWFLQKLKKEQVQYINPALFSQGLIVGTEYFQPSFYASLTKNQMSAMSKENLIHWGIPQIKSLTPDAISGLTKDQFESIGTSPWGNQSFRCTKEQLLASLNPDQRASLSTGVKSLFSEGQLKDPSLGSLGIVQLASLTIDQVQALTPEQLKTVGKDNIYLLTEVSFDAMRFLQKLTTEQVQYISPRLFTRGLIWGFEFLQPSFYAGLTAAQLSESTSSVLQNWGIPQVKSLSLEALSGLRGVPFREYIGTGNRIFRCTTTELLASLTIDQIKALSQSVMEQLSASELASLTTEKVRALSADQLSRIGFASLNNEGVNRVWATNHDACKFLAKLDVSQVQYLFPYTFYKGLVWGVDYLPASFFSGLSARQLQAASEENLNYFRSNQIASLSPDALSILSFRQFQALGAAFDPNNIKTTLSSLNTTQVAALSKDVLASLSIFHLSVLTADQVHALTPSQLKAVGGKVGNLLTEVNDYAMRFLQNLTTEQVQYINPALFSQGLIVGTEYFQPSFYASLTKSQMSAMSKENLIHWGIAHIKSLTPDAISGLTKDQFESIGTSSWGNQSFRCTKDQLLASLSDAQRNALLWLRPSTSALLEQSAAKSLNLLIQSSAMVVAPPSIVIADFASMTSAKTNPEIMFTHATSNYLVGVGGVTNL